MKFRARFVLKKLLKTSIFNKIIISCLLAVTISSGFHVYQNLDEYSNPDKIKNSVNQIKKFYNEPFKSMQSYGLTKGVINTSEIGSVITLFFLLIRTARQYKINPSKLIAGKSPTAKMKDFEEYLGFRHKFSEAFSEAIESLKPGRLVVLVDDLDRCKYDHVIEVLESINFLSTSGDCFIILGIDKLRVVQCIGKAFEDIAEIPEEFYKNNQNQEDNNGNKENKNESSDKYKRQIDFANNYLEKLINIEVPVPKPKEGQTKKLLKNEELDSEETSENKSFIRVIYNSIIYAKKTIRYAFFPALIILISWFASNNMDKFLKDSEKIEVKPLTVQEEEKVLPTPEPKASAVPTPKPEEETKIAFPTGEEMKGKVSKEHWLFWAVPSLIILLLVGFYIYRNLNVKSFIASLKPPDIDDSPKFKQGLEQWHDLITYKSSTPRSIKRFLNRIRFLAMLQGDEPKVETVIEKLVEKFSESKSKDDKSGGSSSDAQNEKIIIPEDMLVGFAAVENIYPGWFEKAENNFKEFHSYFSNEERITEFLIGGEAGCSDKNEYLYYEKLNKSCIGFEKNIINYMNRYKINDFTKYQNAFKTLISGIRT